MMLPSCEPSSEKSFLPLSVPWLDFDHFRKTTEYQLYLWHSSMVILIQNNILSHGVSLYSKDVPS